MKENKKKRYKIWHSYFANTLKIILGKSYIVETEIEVGRLPLNIDIVVIKKSSTKILKSKNNVKAFNTFNKYNIIEYKSPDDILDIDSFDKLFAYALLYKIKYKISSREFINTYAFVSGDISHIEKYILRNQHKLTKLDDGLYYSNLGFNFYLIKLDELKIDISNFELLLFGKMQDKKSLLNQIFRLKSVDLKNIIDVSKELYPETFKEVIETMGIKEKRKMYKDISKDFISTLGEKKIVQTIGEDKIVRTIGEDKIVRTIGEVKLLKRLVKKFGLKKVKELTAIL